MRRRIAWVAVMLGFSGMPAAAWAQDADRDGVVDAADVAPCDPEFVAEQFWPAEGRYGTFLFEDNWPNRGDFDFNDLVVAVHGRFQLDALGRLSRLHLDLEVRATGALNDNGLAYRLPVPAAALASATLTRSDGGSSELEARAGDSELVLTLVEQARSLLGNRVALENTEAGAAAVAPVHLGLDVRFDAPRTVDTGDMPFDLFLFDASRAVEVHLPAYSGTTALDPNLFGTGVDQSTPGRNFVDLGGIPFALAVPVLVDHPLEQTPIDRTFPEIVQFGASAGSVSADFYARPVVSQAYAAVPAPAALAEVEHDRSCTTPPGSSAGLPGLSCAALLADGQWTDGLYWVDPDGAGGLEPYQAWCDQSTDGGGWMLVMANRRQVATMVAIEGAVTPDLPATAIDDVRWGYLRDHAAEARATWGTNGVRVARMDAMRTANCKPLARSLTEPMLAHAENSGCSGSGSDYSLWFGYRNGWGRANAIYDFSSRNFFDGGYANPGVAHMWVR